MNTDVIIPSYAYDLLRDVQVTDKEEIKKFVSEYIAETGDYMVDWFEFQRWVSNSILSY